MGRVDAHCPVLRWYEKTDRLDKEKLFDYGFLTGSKLAEIRKDRLSDHTSWLVIGSRRVTPTCPDVVAQSAGLHFRTLIPLAARRVFYFRWVSHRRPKRPLASAATNRPRCCVCEPTMGDGTGNN